MSLKVAKKQPDQSGTCEAIEKILVEAEEQFKLDTSLPLDHSERKRFEMFECMKNYCAYFEKLKLRFYTEDYRGFHASSSIKKGETILLVPLQSLITLYMAMESPIGSLIIANNFRERLIS